MKSGEYKNKKSILVESFMVAMIVVVYAMTMQFYIIAISVAILFYVAHAILWTDHIFYNPSSDYQFKFGDAKIFEGTLSGDQITLLSPLSLDVDTCILPIPVKAGLLGFLFDPYVELSAGNVISRQYFERGVDGQRFLNVSRLLEALQKANNPIRIYCRHCSVPEGLFSLLGFSNTSYKNKRILIVAPHADDAELAAFALYKHASSALIVTITAGEVDAKSYEVVAGKGNKVAAGLLKGRLRAWDSIAIPLWAGRHIESIHLGYFCMTLKEMYDHPEQVIPSRETGSTDVRSFRQCNQKILPTDQQGDNSWRNLLADLTALINEYQPDVIVTPHPKLDAHVDHLYSTRAVLVASEAVLPDVHFLLYANHNQHTDMYPFGLEHSDLALPPHFNDVVIAEKLFSLPLSIDDQRDKICALQMMHDLNRPMPLKKRLRRLLQRLIGRSAMPYGDDEYLRKAIKQQELFWVASMSELKKQFD